MARWCVTSNFILNIFSPIASALESLASCAACCCFLSSAVSACSPMSAWRSRSTIRADLVASGAAGGRWAWCGVRDVRTFVWRKR